MDLALNNLQSLIGHKTKQTNKRLIRIIIIINHYLKLYNSVQIIYIGILDKYNYWFQIGILEIIWLCANKSLILNRIICVWYEHFQPFDGVQTNDL